MIELDRTVAGEDRVFRVYTKDEADEQGIEYTDWRYGREGDWCLTDDGYVGELVKVQKYDRQTRISFFLTFSFARKWLSRDKETGEIVGDSDLNAEEFLEKGAYYQTSPKDWIEVELQKTRTKRAISLYATLMVANGGELTDEEWDLIGNAYRPDQENPRATVKRLFKNERVQTVANDELAQLLNNNGVTKKSVVENYERLRKEAMADGKYNTAFRVLEKQEEMLGLDQDLAGIAPEEDQNKEIEEANAQVLDEIEGDLDDRET